MTTPQPLAAPPATPAAPLSSMTAFARAAGTSGPWRFAWELRSVNGKALDVRLRVPAGFDEVEARARAQVGQALARGSVSASLSANREGETVTARVNRSALAALYRTAAETAAALSAPPPGLDALLAAKGIVEVVELEIGEAERTALAEAVLAAFHEGLVGLGAMRAREGEALRQVLAERLGRIEALVDAAEALPGRGVEKGRSRLADQVRALVDAAHGLDPERLHQEAVMIATRADVREELDRLRAHVAAARALLDEGGPVGRRLDFLAQEFNREANTLCAKSNAIVLTRIGLDLKLLVDQFREQVQNLE